jgi:PAT family beta-lactamase induction signal transducer AmpG
VAAALSAALAASVFAAPKTQVAAAALRDTLPALRRWLAAGNGGAVIAFVMLYRLGDQAMGPMVTPFWADRGLSNEEIATVSGVLGIGAYVLGAAIGGWTVSNIGIRAGLWWFGALALLSNLAYAAVAAIPESGRVGVYAASLTESLCGGLVTAAFLSYLMRLCEREHAAVQYALLTAAYALPGAVAASQSGILTERFDYATYFAITAALALPAFALLPRAARSLDPRWDPPAAGA